jgi:hypothetical protein
MRLYKQNNLFRTKTISSNTFKSFTISINLNNNVLQSFHHLPRIPFLKVQKPTFTHFKQMNEIVVI